MTVEISTPTLSTTPPTSVRRLRGAAVVRMVYGIIWSIDATFRWLPGFVHGQTLDKELGSGAKIQIPVVHQWIELWHSLASVNPAAFAVGTAIIETLIAAGMLLGAFGNAVFIGSAAFLRHLVCGRRIPFAVDQVGHHRPRPVRRLHRRVARAVLRGRRCRVERGHLAAPEDGPLAVAVQPVGR